MDDLSALIGTSSAAADRPYSAITSLTLESKTKTIYHNYGCRLHPDSPIYPEPLTDLERKIDEITETKQWLK